MRLMARTAFLLGFLTLVASATTFTQASAQARCQAASLEEAKALAVKAAKALVDLGPEKAFRRFSDPEDEFIDRDLYVFAIDLGGRIWFNAVFPTAPGSNILGSRDSNGRYFIQDMIRTARTKGEGWVEYEWLSPCTGEMSPKAAYVVRVGPVLVAVGAYGVVSL